MRAVTMGVPALVLIRRPKDTASSLVLRNPHLTVKAALERYLVFYRGMTTLRNRVVLADFEDAVSDLGSIINRINTKFSTDFKPFVHSPENLAAVEAMLRKEDAIMQADDLMSYRPNRPKDIAKARVEFVGVENMLRKCESLYDELSPAAARPHGRSDSRP
jgi:hypothetical protein